ncbi:MAG: glutamine--fructose-6-phosphate transaminase (isomerizing), partial [Burkholderiaceae bacterium]|nr:glutamine--fructose-6-phosphate transaminase (isomerizing) [Burkholderiaceae bacterium]
MCGIVGAVAQRDIVPVLIEGLRRLEYRGYDSCGVAVYADGELKRVRSVGRVAELDARTRGLQAFIGIAHTRWATHGAPTTDNAHPHFSGRHGAARIALVHNGIIENHDVLRARLSAQGYRFESQTDTEVIAHLIDSLYDGDLFEAVQKAVRELHGAYAIAVFAREEPHRVVGARAGSPLVVGLGDGECFLASDALALAGTTERIVYLEEGDVVDLQLGRMWIVDAHGRPVAREVRTVQAGLGSVELGPYRHFMQKEIFEQPRAIADTLDPVAGIDPVLFGEAAPSVLPRISRVLILACGTSHYAGCVARYWIEAIARVPTTVEIASEYRYRASVPDPDT